MMLQGSGGTSEDASKNASGLRDAIWGKKLWGVYPPPCPVSGLGRNSFDFFSYAGENLARFSSN